MKTIPSLFVISIGLVALGLACGDDDPAAVAGDAGTDSPPSDTGTSNPSGDGATSPTNPTGPCQANELCFDVTPLRPGTTPLPGRLTLIWFQLDDDGPDPAPKIGYQAPFSGTESRVVIPLAQVVPPDEVHLVCERACEDEATCPCLSEPKVGIGLVAVFSRSRRGSLPRVARRRRDGGRLQRQGVQAVADPVLEQVPRRHRGRRSRLQARAA